MVPPILRLEVVPVDPIHRQGSQHEQGHHQGHHGDDHRGGRGKGKMQWLIKAFPVASPTPHPLEPSPSDHGGDRHLMHISATTMTPSPR